MQSKGWIPLINISNDEKIWVGTKIRLFNAGLNVTDKEYDYYDYLVSYIYDNNDLLQLTNLSQGEAGNILCVIPKEKPYHYSLGKSLKDAVGLDNSYVLFE
ncbi:MULTISPECIES: hypothetical protein [Paenibacillus]|uniref:Uncharacterized protein n=1 Tax=Paenibacillus cineris TaxID=237530 RepID=A0ABQ4LJZ0_9BACL|nr:MULTISPECIES: hypothetical protein [Paenibacillus]UYO06490.1 hypothetical protein K2F33_11745 [Paenibacillus sp. PSB04]GIO56844.1 hypothetical protein J21TS7_51620 [Paenibacillus cineris]